LLHTKGSSEVFEKIIESLSFPVAFSLTSVNYFVK